MLIENNKVKNIYEVIHQNALQSARAYKKSEHSLLCAIQQVDAKKVYFKYGFKNLFEYGTRCLKLSEGTVYSFIRVAKKSVEIPEIKRAIEQGELTLSHAKTLTRVITEENQEEWLTKAKNMSVRQLEAEVAKKNPDTEIREKLKTVSENRIKLECGISPETEKLIQRAKDILCQRTQEPLNLEKTIEQVFQDFIRKNDPLVKKTQKATLAKFGEGNRAAEKVSTWENLDSNPNIAKPPTTAMKNFILRRDECQCQGVDPFGNPCLERKWLDVHHVLPRSQGGTNTTKNLITLCRGHHRLLHFKK